MRGVVFDMDGLMLDTERLCVLAWDYAGEQLGIGPVGYLNLKTLGLTSEAGKAVLREHLGEDYDEQGLTLYTREFFDRYYQENKVPVKKGLVNLLSYLKKAGYRLAVASSTKKSQVEWRLGNAGVLGYFDVVVCGDMVLKSKPEPDIYQTACELLQLEPRECYALEDSRNGLLSAYRAGCSIVMIPDLWQPDDEIKGIVSGIFEDLDAFAAYLEKTGESPNG